MDDASTGQQPAASKPWWRERGVIIIVGLVIAAYFVRVGDVSMRGEESRRAQVAFEMVRRGDWVVPREQGSPFLSRPPLQNWLIAVSTTVCGSRAPWAVRLPSVLAMLLTALLIYGYARTGLSQAGALAAAVAFVTFAEMFTTGCQAETEMVFIALVSGSLLLWHWGGLRGWPATRTWVVSYVLVGLGILCKGPQPPVYFLAAVGAYLLLNGGWRRLFERAHFIGAAAGAAVVLAWLVPCALRTSWPEVWAIFMNDTSGRFRDWKVLDVADHLVQFPLEVLGCTLPWSLFLAGFASRDVRRSLGAARPQAVFTALCVGMAFPTCWIPPEGQTRYFSPLYPCLAVLAGVVVEACMRSEVPARLKAGWRRFAQLTAGVMIASAAAVVAAAFTLRNNPRFGEWAEPVPLALAYAVAAAGLAVLAVRCRKAGDVRRVLTGVLAVAAFMVLTFAGVVTDARVRRSEDQASAVARLKEQLPRGQRLTSLGHIDALFAYYFAEPIDPVPPTVAGAEKLLAAEDFYFCFDSEGGWRPTLPFAWQELAVISMDRNRHDVPTRTVVVGRRLPSAKTAARAVPRPAPNG